MRVVAEATALDAARWDGEDVDVIRIAPDEALGIGATGVHVEDPDAIVEPESGFSVALLGPEFVLLGAHTEWPLPETPGTLAQGKLAGVPAKLVIGDPTLLVVQTAYADELTRRLGW
jgi:hypothetical protein